MEQSNEPPGPEDVKVFKKTTKITHDFKLFIHNLGVIETQLDYLLFESLCITRAPSEIKI